MEDLHLLVPTKHAATWSSVYISVYKQNGWKNNRCVLLAGHGYTIRTKMLNKLYEIKFY